MSVYFTPPIALWLLIAFMEWDLYWLSDLGNQDGFHRYSLLLCLSILYIILTIYKRKA